ATDGAGPEGSQDPDSDLRGPNPGDRGRFQPELNPARERERRRPLGLLPTLTQPRPNQRVIIAFRPPASVACGNRGRRPPDEGAVSFRSVVSGQGFPSLAESRS